jgi:hypothetical protein
MPFQNCPDCPTPAACASAGKCLNPKHDHEIDATRKNTTMSGQPRDEENYGLREFLDDYGPMSIITRMLQGHDDEIPAMPPGLGGLGFDALSTDPDAPSMKDYQEYEQKHFDEIRKRRSNISEDIMNSGKDGFGKMMDADELRNHYSSMQGGDDTLTYAQSGEMVIPRRVQANFPELAMAVQLATAKSGLNPDQYVVGSEEGSYNKNTGVQQFADPWYVTLYEDAKDWASDSWTNIKDDVVSGAKDWAEDPLGSDLTQSALAGVSSYGAAKLAGADNDQALQAAIGGAAGYGLAGMGEEADISTTQKILSGAMGAYGAYNAYQPPPPEPTYTPSAPLPSNYGQILNSVPVGYGADNEQANLSMTLPSATPPAYTGVTKPEGVSYLEEVDDRDGGTSYVDKGPQYSPTFGRSISAQSRRGDLGGFGNKVLYM